MVTTRRQAAGAGAGEGREGACATRELYGALSAPAWRSTTERTLQRRQQREFQAREEEREAREEESLAELERLRRRFEEQQRREGEMRSQGRGAAPLWSGVRGPFSFFNIKH